MSILSDLFINKHALELLGFEVPFNLNNGLYYSDNSTPLALLAIISETTQGTKTLADINNSLTNLTVEANNKNNDLKLESYFKYYGFNDEVNMMKIVNKHSSVITSQQGIADLAHYMFLSGYNSINQVEDEECFNVYKYGKVLRSVPQNETLPTGLGRILSYVEDVYSKSEAFTIMFIDKESKVDLFINENEKYGRILNSLVYQLLMNYHYYVSNIIRKHYYSEAEAVRLKEFITYDGRQKFYSVVHSLVSGGGNKLIAALESADSNDIYNITDLVVEKIQILLVSELNIDIWGEYLQVPNAWLESLVGDSGQLWKQAI